MIGTWYSECGPCPPRCRQEAVSRPNRYVRPIRAPTTGPRRAVRRPAAVRLRFRLRRLPLRPARHRVHRLARHGGLRRAAPQGPPGRPPPRGHRRRLRRCGGRLRGGAAAGEVRSLRGRPGGPATPPPLRSRGRHELAALGVDAAICSTPCLFAAHHAVDRALTVAGSPTAASPTPPNWAVSGSASPHAAGAEPRRRPSARRGGVLTRAQGCSVASPVTRTPTVCPGRTETGPDVRTPTGASSPSTSTVTMASWP